METLRVCLRLPLVFFCLAMIPITIHPVCLFVRDADRQYAWKCAMLQRWTRAMLRVIGARVEVKGERPRDPFILVSNHLGYMDIICYAATLPSYFISKKEVGEWAFVGWVVRSTPTLFVDRKNHKDLVKLEDIISGLIQDRRSLIFFPEGTSTKGSEVLPFMSSLLEAPAREAFPVSNGSITYRTEPGAPPAHEAVCWWGDMEFMGHLVNLMKLKTFYATITFGSERHTHSDRKELAMALRNAVLSRFVPVPSEEVCNIPS
jgi:1-acyl-sn-glycerol-3-phosphate acyltransferase